MSLQIWIKIKNYNYKFKKQNVPTNNLDLNKIFKV